VIELKKIISPKLFYGYILIVSVFLFVVISFFDYKNSNGFFIFPDETYLQENYFEDEVFYVYDNNAIIKDFDYTKNDHILFLNFLNNNYEKIFICEFFDFDKNFSSFKNSLDENLLKKINYVHYIKSEEIDKYDDSIVIQRFVRSYRERNIRYFLFPENEKTENIKDNIIKRLGEPKGFNYIKFISPPIFISYTGIFSIILVFLYFIPIFNVFYILSLVFFFEWSFTITAALLSIIIFQKISDKSLIKIIAFSIMFGIFIYASGYNDFFILKLNAVRGVKLSLLILPLFILLLNLKKIRFEKFEKSSIIVMILFFLSFIIFIIRSGNFGHVLDLERKIRDFLERILIARPRTKEFFSYFFYFLNPDKNYKFIWKISRSILPVSILNTFLHFHTPLYLGVLRTLHSFWISAFILFVFLGIKNFTKFKK